jgi:hypothetical protein
VSDTEIEILKVLRQIATIIRTLDTDGVVYAVDRKALDHRMNQLEALAAREPAKVL